MCRRRATPCRPQRRPPVSAGQALRAAVVLLVRPGGGLVSSPPPGDPTWPLTPRSESAIAAALGELVGDDWQGWLDADPYLRRHSGPPRRRGRRARGAPRPRRFPGRGRAGRSAGGHRRRRRPRRPPLPASGTPAGGPSSRRAGRHPGPRRFPGGARCGSRPGRAAPLELAAAVGRWGAGRWWSPEVGRHGPGLGRGRRGLAVLDGHDHGVTSVTVGKAGGWAPRLPSAPSTPSACGGHRRRPNERRDR